MSDTERLCEQIEKLFVYLAHESDSGDGEGDKMWQTIHSPKRAKEMGEWLAESGTEDVVDLVQKFFRAMYLAFLDGKGEHLVYNTETGLRTTKPDSVSIAKAERPMAVMRPSSTTLLSPDEAAYKVDLAFWECHSELVRQLQTIAFAERDLRRNAAVQRVGC